MRGSMRLCANPSAISTRLGKVSLKLLLIHGYFLIAETDRDELIVGVSSEVLLRKSHSECLLKIGDLDIALVPRHFCSIVKLAPFAAAVRALNVYAPLHVAEYEINRVAKLSPCPLDMHRARTHLGNDDGLGPTELWQRGERRSHHDPVAMLR
jgi:hypothetical protein